MFSADHNENHCNSTPAGCSVSIAPTEGNRIHSNDESNTSIDDFFSWIQHTTEIVVIICNKSTKSIAQKNKLEKVTQF